MNENGKKNIFINSNNAENNWFLSQQQTISVSNFTSNPQRLNDLDSNILEEKAYINVEDETLKLEYRIEDKEKQLNEINKKIKAADTIGNQQELFGLRIKKQRLDKELRELYKEYSSQNISSKISGSSVIPFFASSSIFSVLSPIFRGLGVALGTTITTFSLRSTSSVFS